MCRSKDLPVELVSLRELFDAPEGVDPYRWPEVVQLAEARMDAAGIVTTADLVDAGCASRRAQTLSRGAGHASRMGGRRPRQPRAVGKPPLACVKHKQDSNINIPL
jgi:hypothetical protein